MVRPQMKKLITTIIITFLWVGSLYLTVKCVNIYRDLVLEQQTVTEQLKNVQRQAGCTMIDAKVWGPESKGKLKPIVEAEEWQSFDQRAQRHFTESGAPE